jgi:excisionase family DNA binding protein
MSRSKAEIASRMNVRRGLDEREAAVYLSLSPSFFRQLVEEGTMPKPRVLGARRIWDVLELDAAFDAIPHEGEVKPSDKGWEDVDAEIAAKIRR